MIRAFSGKIANPAPTFSPLTIGQERIEGRIAFLEAETMRARRTALLSMELQGFDLAVSQHPGKRILIAGWYGADNLGDELMLRAVLEHLPEEALSRTGVLLWDNSTYDRLTLDPRVHAIHYPATTRELDALVDHFDVIVWGGGAILDDGQFNDDAGNFNTGNLFIRINELMIGRGKEVYCLGLSANERLSDKIYLFRLNHIIENASHFSIRDKRSIALLNTLGMPENRITACEDLVFSMSATRSLQKSPSTDYFTVGFVFFHTDNLLDTYAQVVADTLTAAKPFAEGKKLRALLIPFLNEGHFDERVNRDLKSRFDLQANEFDVELAEYELNPALSPILSCDLLVSYKYHSALIACCAGVPCLAVSRSEHAHYANKMAHLAKLAGVPDSCIGSTAFENDTAHCVQQFPTHPHVPVIESDVYASMASYMDSICKEIAS